MVAAAGNQAALADGVEEAAGGAVVEHCGRDRGGVGDGHRGMRVALHGADALAIGGEGEALLVVVLDHRAEQHAVEGAAVPRRAGDQGIDVGPAFAVQRQADGLGLVAKDIAEELAGVVEGFPIHSMVLVRAIPAREPQAPPRKSILPSSTPLWRRMA